MLPLISPRSGVFCVPLRGEVEKLHRVKRSGTVLASRRIISARSSLCRIFRATLFATGSQIAE